MTTNPQMVCGPLQPQMNQPAMNHYAHLNTYAPPADYRSAMPAVTSSAPVPPAAIQPPGPSQQIIENLDDGSNRRSNYKSQFTAEALSKLLELVKMNYAKLRNKQVKKLKVWEQIRQELEHLVPGVTRDQVDKKWRNLLFSYKKYLINRAKNGKNRVKKPEMFEEIKAIVGEGHTIKYRFVPTNNFASQPVAPPVNNMYPFTEPEVNLVVFDGGSGQQASEPPSPPDDSPGRENKKDKKSRAQVRMESIQSSLDRLVNEIKQMRKEEMQVMMLRLQEERDFRNETREFHKEFLNTLRKKNDSLEKYIAMKSNRN